MKPLQLVVLSCSAWADGHRIFRYNSFGIDLGIPRNFFHEILIKKWWIKLCWIRWIESKLDITSAVDRWMLSEIHIFPLSSSFREFSANNSIVTSWAAMAGRMSCDQSTSGEWVFLILHMSASLWSFLLFHFGDENSRWSLVNLCLRSCYFLFPTERISGIYSTWPPFFVFCVTRVFVEHFRFSFLPQGSILVAFTFPKSRATARPSFWKRWWENTEELWDARSNASSLGSARVPTTRWSPFRILSMIVLHLDPIWIRAKSFFFSVENCFLSMKVLKTESIHYSSVGRFWNASEESKTIYFFIYLFFFKFKWNWFMRLVSSWSQML